MKKILEFFAKVFGQALFALVSFFVILFLFSLFFLGLGIGAGTQSGFGQLKDSGTETYERVSGKESSDNRLLQLTVSGIILGNRPEDDFTLGFSEFLTYGYDIADSLAEAAKDDTIKGIFMPFRTPGGTIFGSRAIYRAISDYREQTGKPVIVYIEGLSASGGVMAMVGADAIYADHGSLIGSIGVLGPSLMYFDKPTAIDGGLFGGGITTEGGIERTTITAGRGKDIGNPFRRPTEEEITTLTQGVENEYDDFVTHVAQHRGMDEAMIRDEMGAQIFDNRTAEAYGLINGTLDRQAAIDELAKAAALGDDYQLVRPANGARGLFNQLMGVWHGQTREAQRRAQQQLCSLGRQMSLVYHGSLVDTCL